MRNRDGRDFDERERGEFSGGPLDPATSDFGGDYARDPHAGSLGDDYARDGGWSGAGRADQHVREGDPEPAPVRTSHSDDRIRDAVRELLTAHDEVDASGIDVRVESGEVTLRGTVTSRQQKRLAAEAASSCPGVQNVHDRLKIEDREQPIGKASE